MPNENKLEERTTALRFFKGPAAVIKTVFTLLSCAAFSCSIALLLISPWFADNAKVVVIGGYIFVPLWAFALCLCAWTKSTWRMAIIFLAIGAALIGINYAWVNL